VRRSSKYSGADILTAIDVLTFYPFAPLPHPGLAMRLKRCTKGDSMEGPMIGVTNDI